MVNTYTTSRYGNRLRRTAGASGPLMHFETTRFLDKELLALFGENDVQSHTDALILLDIELDGRLEWMLIHWEQQDRRQDDFEQRMFRYFCGIYFRYQKLVFPIAMFTDPGKWKKPVPDRFQLSLLEHPIVEYHYQLIRLKGYTAGEFEEKGATNPLVWAYLPLTDYDRRDRPWMVARAMRGVADTVRDSGKQATLFSLIERSVPLNAEEKREFEEFIVRDERFREVRMLQSMEELGIEKGIEQGMARGEIRATLRMIRGLLENHAEWELITKATGITPQEYERLRRENQPEEKRSQ